MWPIEIKFNYVLLNFFSKTSHKTKKFIKKYKVKADANLN